MTDKNQTTKTSLGSSFDNPVRIFVLGESWVGKSCLVMQLTTHQFVCSSDPTITDEYKVVVNGVHVVLLECSTSFYEFELEFISRGSYQITGIIFLYSILNEKSVEEGLKYAQTLKSMTNNPPLFAVIGTHLDKKDERKVSVERGQEIARELGDGPFFEISNLTREGLEEAIEGAARYFIDNDLHRGNQNEDEDEDKHRKFFKKSCVHQ